MIDTNHKKIAHKLKKRGWDKKSISHSVKILKKAEKKKSKHIKKLDKSVYWIFLFLIILVNAMIFLGLIPVFILSPEWFSVLIMGIFGVFGVTGMALGPVIGPIISKAFGINTLFYVSTAFGMLSVLVLMGMKETLAKPEPFRFSMLKVKFSEVYEPRVWAPVILMILSGGCRF